MDKSKSNKSDKQGAKPAEKPASPSSTTATTTTAARNSPAPKPVKKSTEKSTDNTTSAKSTKVEKSSPPPVAANANAGNNVAKKDAKPADKKDEKPNVKAASPEASQPKEKESKNAKKAGKDVKTSKEAKEVTPEPRPEELHENPYVEVLAHRQRALRKRLIKIEKNEEALAQGIKLNEDQLASISQKQEVTDLIRELDDLIKHLCDAAIEQDKEAKKQAKLKKAEELKQSQVVKEQHQEEIRQIVESLYLINVFGQQEIRAAFTAGQVEGFTLTKEQAHTMDVLSTNLFPAYQSSKGLLKTSKEIHQKITKLSAKGKEEIGPGLNGTKASNTLSSISNSSYFNLEVAAKIAEEKAAAEAAAAAAKAVAEAAALAAAEAARREQEEMQNSYEMIDPNEVPESFPLSREQINGTPAPTIAFMGESELLGGDSNFPVFDQASPSVIIPVPQAIVETHGMNIPLNIVPLVNPKQKLTKSNPTSSSTSTSTSSSSTSNASASTSTNQTQQPSTTTPTSSNPAPSSQDASSPKNGTSAPVNTNGTPSEQQNPQDQQQPQQGGEDQQQLDRRQQRGPRNSHHNNPNPNGANNRTRGFRNNYNNSYNYNGYNNNYHGNGQGFQKTNYQERNFSGGNYERRGYNNNNNSNDSGNKQNDNGPRQYNNNNKPRAQSGNQQTTNTQ